MMLHYLGKFKIRNFALIMHVKRFKCELVSSIQLIPIKCHENKCKDWHYAKCEHFTFCSFTLFNKLKPLKLSKVGLSTIERQHSKNLT